MFVNEALHMCVCEIDWLGLGRGVTSSAAKRRVRKMEGGRFTGRGKERDAK